MKYWFCCVLLVVSAARSQAQTVAPKPGSGLAIARLEDFIEITKHVAEQGAPAGSPPEARPEINRLLVLAAFDFVQITRNGPSREAYLESIDRNLARLDPLLLLPAERQQVAEFYDDLLEMVGVESTDGRLNEFTARRPAIIEPAQSPMPRKKDKVKAPELAPAPHPDRGPLRQKRRPTSSRSGLPSRRKAPTREPGRGFLLG